MIRSCKLEEKSGKYIFGWFSIVMSHRNWKEIFLQKETNDATTNDRRYFQNYEAEHMAEHMFGFTASQKDTDNVF